MKSYKARSLKECLMLIVMVAEMMMVSALMMERIDSIVMMSITRPSIVIVVKMHFNDGDFLSQLLRHTKAEVLAASARGLPNFKIVRKSAE